MSRVKSSFARVLLAACLCSSVLDACSSEQETVDRRACEKLRDHLIDVRVSTDGKPDRDAAQHREAMKAALGDDFLATCERTMSVEQLRCAMHATDLGATSDCSRAARASN